MSPEEFNRLKEQHKAHLRELKKLKGLARDAGRQGRLAQAIEGITSAISPDATYDEVMDTLNRETAEAEARFEVARESASLAPGDDSLEKAAEAEARAEALSRDRARSLVEQMKGQMGGPLSASPPDDEATSKTLGRPRSEGGDAPAERPDKTLGRRS